MQETSIQAGRSVTKEMREAIHVKIVNALQEIGTGSFEDIAKAAHMEDDQIWKRLVECKRAGKIVDTPYRKKLKSGCYGQVYSLPGLSVKLTA